MEIQAFSSQLTFALFDKPYTLWHRAKVKVVRVLAIVSHFTEISKIVLADR